MKSIDAKTYLSILRQFIHDGKKVCVNISGSSMAPFLINHRDSVCLAAAHRPLIPGDIVFYQRDNGQFVLHRICKIKKISITLQVMHRRFWKAPSVKIRFLQGSSLSAAKDNGLVLKIYDGYFLQ